MPTRPTRSCTCPPGAGGCRRWLYSLACFRKTKGREAKEEDMKDLEKLLGAEARGLLEHACKTVPRELLHLPGPDFVERVLIPSDRPIPVLRNLQSVFGHGR